MVVADLDAMRRESMSDRDILDVNQTVAYFAYVNRVADGLGVATDQYAIDAFPMEDPQ
jgi:alkylhydroperoxidase family enzyme